MKNNIGKYDRLLRIILGLIIIILGFNQNYSIYTSWFLFFIGLVILSTGFIGWCGIYSICNISSKGAGIDKISKKDIERAVKINSIKTIEKKEKKVPSKNEVKKKSTKKVEKKPKTTKKKTESKTKSKTKTTKSNVSKK